MANHYYAKERNIQILIFLLKAHKVRKIIASPGTRNFSFVLSLQEDKYFELYSCVDERSAAYMACGLSEATGEPVAITCTGATASRNYLPALTEAYYRKIPVLAITGDTFRCRVGHLHPQVIDRQSTAYDVCNISERIESVNDEDSEWDATLRINHALLELRHHGGGPVHIDLVTGNCQDFSVKELPQCRVIQRFLPKDVLPAMEGKRIAIFSGAHHRMSHEENEVIDIFCQRHNAVFFGDHTSGYSGKFKIPLSLINWQKAKISNLKNVDILIHIGEVSGDYAGSKINAKEVWRVSEDGELRDTFRKLSNVFEMPEQQFFSHYSMGLPDVCTSYYEECKKELMSIMAKVPDLPLSNVWIAQQLSSVFPPNSVLHFGILNSLRSWNFFPIPSSVECHCNVGGFGIDGPVSTLIGASLSNDTRTHYLVVGDLAFFYDMNALGNRHVKANVRLLLVNNGRGTEFRIFCHPAFPYGKDADPYIAASGHYSDRHRDVVKQYVESLGFEYLSAEDKTQFQEVSKRFLTSEKTDRPMVFEVFTKDADENSALEIMANLEHSSLGLINKVANEVLPPEGKEALKKIVAKIIK